MSQIVGQSKWVSDLWERSSQVPLLHYISRVYLEAQDAARTCASANPRWCPCNDNGLAIETLGHCRRHGPSHWFWIEERPDDGLRPDLWTLWALDKMENVPTNRWIKHVELTRRSLLAADYPHKWCIWLSQCRYQTVHLDCESNWRETSSINDLIGRIGVNCAKLLA